MFYYLAINTRNLATPLKSIRLFGRLRYNNKINYIIILYRAALDLSTLSSIMALNIADRTR